MRVHIERSFELRMPEQSLDRPELYALLRELRCMRVSELCQEIKGCPYQKPHPYAFGGVEVSTIVRAY